MLSVSLVTLSAGLSHAQLFLEDGKKTLDVSGGEHINGSLLIHNNNGDPGDVKAYWEDFEYKPPYDGSKNFLPAGTSKVSANQWVTFAPTQFTLPGFGRQKIDYTVTVPAAIAEGHYGVLFFERSSQQLKDEGGLTLVTRVGCLFFIEPKNKNKTASVENIAVKGQSLTADFANKGNVILIPSTTYYVLQNSGVVVLRGELNKLYVPAGASASFEIPFKEQLKPGRYNMVINCDLQDGDVQVKEINLTVDASGGISAASV